MKLARATMTSIAVLAAACSTKADLPKLGSMELTTSAPTAEKGFTTTDGWSITYGRFLVHVTAAEVAGADGVVAASATGVFLDQVAPGPKSLLSATLRTARPWESVSLEIGPAAKDEENPTLLDPVKDADRDMMQAAGLSLYVEGKATKSSAVKTFKWGFTTDTTFGDCEESNVPGLVVPPDGKDTADIGMAGNVLFADDLAAGALRFDVIAGADANDDGDVTLDELKAVTLETARQGGGAYATGDDAGVGDLGAFVQALTPRVVARFRAAGTCKIVHASK